VSECCEDEEKEIEVEKEMKGVEGALGYLEGDGVKKGHFACVLSEHSFTVGLGTGLCG